jgi:hypothetical protein
VREDPKHGLTHQIGYGHGISKDSPYFGRTITLKEALDLLYSDLIKARANAKKIFEQSVDPRNLDPGKFDRLSESQKDILTDFAYNGVLDKFPQMMKAIANADPDTAIKECSRCYTENGVKKPMIGRNEGTVKLIRDGHPTWKKVNIKKPDSD